MTVCPLQWILRNESDKTLIFNKLSLHPCDAKRVPERPPVRPESAAVRLKPDGAMPQPERGAARLFGANSQAGARIPITPSNTSKSRRFQVSIVLAPAFRAALAMSMS